MATMKISHIDTISIHPIVDVKLLATGWIPYSFGIEKVITKYIWSPIVWQDGIRKSENFLSSSYLALDFDTPGYSIKDSINFLEENKLFGVIGTTKSHQKKKGKKEKCDRYRLIMKWSKTITEKSIYELSIKKIMRMFPSCDKACKDSARFFFPCTSVIYKQGGRLLTVLTEPPNDKKKTPPKKSKNAYKSYPPAIQKFLDLGDYSGFVGRQDACFQSACYLIEYGMSEKEIEILLTSCPFSHHDFTESELKAAVKSAAKRSKERI